MTARGPIDLTREVLGLSREGGLRAVESPPGPPVRIEGHTIDAPLLTREPPHDGEMHPDGDELLFLVAGRVTVVIEDEDPPREVPLARGQATIVPQGVWHKLRLHEPSQILYVTPGPGGAHRPMRGG